MQRMGIKISVRQTVNITPQLLQSIRILQMNDQELVDYLDEISLENPTLEIEPNEVRQQEFAALCERFRWLNNMPGQSASSASGREDADDPFDYAVGCCDPELENLEGFLRDQLDRLTLAREERAVCLHLASLVDSDGRLAQGDLDDLAARGVPKALLESAQAVLQSLEPAGVAARDLRECLLLQLARLPEPQPLAVALVSEHLQALASHRYAVLAESLRVGVAEIRQAETLIQSLDPRPGAAFSAETAVQYVRPDLFVTETDGKAQLLLNDYSLPQIFLNPEYLHMLERTDDPAVKLYLQQKLRQAKWVMSCVTRRHSTLEACASVIVEHQQAFFSGQGSLQPLTLADIARRTEFHESTVSRVLRQRYLQCRQGTFPLHYFLSHGVGRDDQIVSEQAAKRALAALIREEDPFRPLSDQKLTERLERQGILLARRTVAKYRVQLGFASSMERRRAEQ